ncbi:cyclodehydratase [Mycolicibacterium goodii]|uniref:Cyclodehydratase n=1 Tax=Mycolicibacterium goodii TaxID=134601 RepID=A0A0K0XD41_MYCGD|nr:cyclodehydratase [Mycolicibacterium goodii]
MTARYALTPGRPVLLRPDGAVQIGWDPRTAVRVRPPDGMTLTQLTDLLHTLQTGRSRDELHSATAQFGGRTVVDDVLDALDSAGVLVRQPGKPARTATIRIHGRGPLSELLAGALRRSGARLQHSTEAHAAPRPGTDLVVLADELVTEPRLVRELHRGRIAHLPVRVRDGTGLVGPLVIPGVTSCLHCADLHRTDRDAAWPALAAQLRGTVGSATRATILATAALALRQVDLVIRAVGGTTGPEDPPQPPATLDTTIELTGDGYTLGFRRWSRHPECRC